jgi:hypothetical protein
MPSMFPDEQNMKTMMDDRARNIINEVLSQPELRPAKLFNDFVNFETSLPKKSDKASKILSKDPQLREFDKNDTVDYEELKKESKLDPKRRLNEKLNNKFNINRKVKLLTPYQKFRGIAKSIYNFMLLFKIARVSPSSLLFITMHIHNHIEIFKYSKNIKISRYQSTAY